METNITKKTVIVDYKRLNLVFGHTEEEWNAEFCTEEFWDFPIEELLDGTIEPNEDIYYWFINGRLYETDEEV